MHKHLFNRLVIILAVYLFAFPCCVSAHAQIAFSARYYYPPGSKKLSHFHIYFMQISTGKVQQLTNSNWDDMDGEFSPDGKYLGFIRCNYFALEDEPCKGWLCLYDMAKKRTVKRVAFVDNGSNDVIKWDKFGDVLYLKGGPELSVNRNLAHVPQDVDPDVSPDGLYKARQVSKHGNYETEVLNVRTGRLIWKMSIRDCPSSVWVAPHTYVLLLTKSYSRAGTSSLLCVTCNGTTVHTKKVPVHDAPASHFKLPPIGQLSGMTSSVFSRYVLIEENDCDSTGGADYGYWRVSVPTGSTEFMGYGADLAFSHNPSVYCTSTNRDLGQYVRRRTVWVSQLVFHSLTEHTSRILVGGLVRVRWISWQ